MPHTQINQRPSCPLIVNIPHASIRIPSHIRFLLPRHAVRREALLLADLYTDRMIADAPHIHKVIAPVSRLVTDTERFTDDALESAAQFGMGVIYTHTHDGRRLRHAPSAAERRHLLATLYEPHHRRLTSLVQSALNTYGHAAILDLHSYPTAFPIPGIQGAAQPDVCIGFDAFHAPEALIHQVSDVFTQAGYSVGFNEPYCGAIVPTRYYLKDARVCSVMLEIKRSIYMDEHTLRPHAGLLKLQGLLNHMAAENLF